MVKAKPSPPFEMTERHLLLEVLIVALDAPAQFGSVPQITEGDVVGQRREPIFGGLFLALGPLDQQPLLRRLLGRLLARCNVNTHAGEPRGQWFMGAFPPLDRAPGLLRQ